MNKRNTHSITTIALGLLLTLGAARLAHADMLESDSFRIDFSDFDTGSSTQTSSGYNLRDTTGQTADSQFTGSTYFVGSGTQTASQLDEFTFTLSKLLIDLGTLTPNSHNTDSHTLTINTQGGSGYSVYAYELHPLRTSGGSTIANTTCDSGTCTISTAAVWSNQAIPGFGYNMSGHDVPATFTDNTYFRPFADRSAAQTMQLVMSSANVAHTRTATVTYKAGVSGSQAAGEYQTGIAFVAIPGF